MAIKLKLSINSKLTNNTKIVVNDLTGRYTSINTTGYGGNNGNPISKIKKYIFEVSNLFTKEKYFQRHSDVPEEGYFINPSIERIAYGAPVNILAYNQDLKQFKDGYLKVDMNVVFDWQLEGDGFEGQDLVYNVPGSDLIEEYDAIIAEGIIYDIIKTKADVQGVIFLDRPIEKAFTVFEPILKASKTFILQEQLRLCLNKKIANMASNCECKDSKAIDEILQIQLLLWGLEEAVQRDDINLAQAYLKSASRLCKCNECGCNG